MTIKDALLVVAISAPFGLAYAYAMAALDLLR